LLRQGSLPRRGTSIYLIHDVPYRAGIHLARTLWLQGYAVQAMEHAHRVIKNAERIDRPVSLGAHQETDTSLGDTRLENTACESRTRSQRKPSNARCSAQSAGR
jgi:hypothetical protein